MKRRASTTIADSQPPSRTPTPLHQRVHALSDGTRINMVQDPGHYCSWSLAGIRKFVAARQLGEDPCEIHPGLLARQAVAHLRGVTVLPDAADYWVVVAFVMATYLFRLFDALPIIHVHGERGSGKSELTAAIAALSFNGQVMAQGSAAALVRLVRESGGLVALDDAEALATGGSEIGQALKQGYKKSTAVKVVAHSRGRTESIDFFGPRVVSNTLGLDPIMGSRAIRISTRASLGEGVDELGGPAFDLAGWRDAAHAFGMSRLDDVASAYASAAQAVRNRQAEIFAPLQAIAQVIGEAEMIEAVALAQGVAL